MTIRLLSLLGLLYVAVPLHAAETSTAFVEGPAWVITAEGVKRRVTESKVTMQPRERLVTGKGAKAVVVTNKDVAVLDQESSLLVRGKRVVEHIGGRIFFAFKKLFGKRSKERRVMTSIATVGIRGTSFLIDGEAARQTIAMDEGEVNVAANQGEFAHFEARPMSEFERYQQQMAQGMRKAEQEFQHYKQQVELDFVAYKKNLTLGDGRMLSLAGNEAVEGEVTDSAKEAMDELKEFLSRYADKI